jgi:hypothetical protein
MKILFVSRFHSGKPTPFVVEQANFVERNFSVKVDHYYIQDGVRAGYGKMLFQLPKIIKAKNVDIVHVHNGLSAFVVILSKILFHRSMKVVITFHGSDLNDKYKRNFSLIASRFSSHNILVSEKMTRFLKKNYSIVPCGIDIDIQLKYRKITRIDKKWNPHDFVILFSSNFERKEKDPEFAFKVVDAFSKSNKRKVKFIELKGYNREQITQLMQAADVLIMCSNMEGSPQVIKEAILNSLPIISNDIGDVAKICAGVDNCYIVRKDIQEFVDHLNLISKQNSRITYRDPVIEKFDNNIISKKLYYIYCGVIKP